MADEFNNVPVEPIEPSTGGSKKGLIIGIVAAVAVIAIIVVVCVLVFGKNKVEGKYKGEFMGIEMKLEIKGSKFTMDMGGDKQTGKAKIDGNKVTLTAEGESIKGTYKDGTLTLDLGEGFKVDFKKQ